MLHNKNDYFPSICIWWYSVETLQWWHKSEHGIVMGTINLRQNHYWTHPGSFTEYGAQSCSIYCHKNYQENAGICCWICNSILEGNNSWIVWGWGPCYGEKLSQTGTSMGWLDWRTWQCSAQRLSVKIGWWPIELGRAPWKTSPRGYMFYEICLLHMHCKCKLRSVRIFATNVVDIGGDEIWAWFQMPPISHSGELEGRPM